MCIFLVFSSPKSQVLYFKFILSEPLFQTAIKTFHYAAVSVTRYEIQFCQYNNPVFILFRAAV